MNTTFLTWLTVAAVVGGALLLFLGTPGSEQAAPLALETLSTEEAATVAGGAYWEPVTPVATRPTAVPVVMQPVNTRPPAAPTYAQQPQVQPCGACGATSPAYVQQTSMAQPCSACGAVRPTPVAPAYGCTSCGWVPVSPYPDTPVSPLDVHTCSSCGSSSVPIYMQYPQMSSCEQRVPSPCGPAPCSGLPMTCVSTCGSTCPLSNPGINRNMELCVEECTFVQLHATIPHPICSDVRFEWTTSKGSFLEANVADPIYYVPTTQFADGEDVWVVVKITDSRGTQYTDQLKLHVINQR